MKILGGVVLAMALSSASFAASSVHEFTMNAIDGQPVSLGSFKGKVMLLVNVASQCGYTPQYEGLQAIYQKYKDRGLVVVGVPANNFGQQEPGTNAEIKEFCTRNYSVTFPMLAKVSVKGADITPLYRFLTDKAANPQTGGTIPWNFTKFLVDRNGKVLARFEPADDPESPEVTSAIEKALKP
jgi:glutathione peroxidase